MNKYLVTGLSLLALGACTMTDMRETFTQSVTQTVTQTSEDAARAVIVPIVMQTPLPGGGTIPEPLAIAMTDCIVTAASADELGSLASAAVTGPTAETSYLVSNILSRPETTGCATAALTGAAAT